MHRKNKQLKMSFQPGVPTGVPGMSMTPIYTATSVPNGTAMMVKVQPVPTHSVMVGQVVQQPFIQAPIMVTQPATQIIHRPPTTRPVVSQAPQLVAIRQPAQLIKKEAPVVDVKPAEAAENAGEPAITVFVGNITDRASDTLIRQILMKCGLVYTWKRVQGASGKLQAFGFCEYRDPESALRAIHILHDYLLGDKKLLVKVDAKTQTQIDEWKTEKGEAFKLTGVEDARNALALLMLEYANELSTAKEILTEASKVEKEKVKEDIILQAHNRENPTVRESANIEENLDTLDIEEDQKKAISKEIRSFRETQKAQEAEKKKQKEAEKENEKKSSSSRRRHSPARDVTSSSRRSTSHRRSPARSPRRSRQRSPPRRSRRSPPPPMLPSRSERERSPRSPARRRERKRSVTPLSPINMRSYEEGDDAHEKRRIERKIKEKEAAYQERLKSYETRERRKRREQEKYEEREHQKRKDMERDAKRLREFLADYDDERFDSKFYVGAELAKRRHERDVEINADQKDRKKEQEEVEILRKRLREENHPDPDAVIQKAIRATEEIWSPLIPPDTPPRSKDHHRSKESAPVEKSEKKVEVEKVEEAKKKEDSSSSSSSDEDSASEASDNESEEDDAMMVDHVTVTSQDFEKVVEKKAPEAPLLVSLPKDDGDDKTYTNTFKQVDQPSPLSEKQMVKMEFSSSSKSSPAAQPQQQQSSSRAVSESRQQPQKRQKLTVSEVFNDDDEDEDEAPKKRKLVPLQYTNEETNAVAASSSSTTETATAKTAATQEEKRKLQKTLIESIPTDKDNLFDFNIDWSQVDQQLMKQRVRPWISKKIVEYIGEDEPTLVEFICSKILLHSPPEKIHEDISMVLDDEAEVFVMKMWRLLIYEIEARKAGIGI